MHDSFWRVYINDVDGAEIVHPGGVHRITAKHIHVVPAWGEFTSRCRGRIEHFFLHLDPGEPLRDIGRWPHPVAAFFRKPITLARDPLMEARLRTISASKDRSPLWYLQAQALGLAAVVACFEAMPATDRERLDEVSDSSDVVLHMLRYIEDHLHLDFDIDELAKRCGLSASHFFRVFRQRTGKTPQRYLQDRRVALAADRLATSPDPIEVIAEKCGFANRYHFSRVFAQRMGVGPAAFRRRQAAG